MVSVSRRPGCPNPDKDRYRDREQAERALAEIVAKFGIDNLGTLHPYECACTRWHIGRGQSGFTWWWKRWGLLDPRFNRAMWPAKQRAADLDARIADALEATPALPPDHRTRKTSRRPNAPESPESDPGDPAEMEASSRDE